MNVQGGRMLAGAATAGAVLCLLLAPIQSAVWNVDDPSVPLIVATMRPVVALGVRIHATFAEPLGLSPYEFWGRLFFLVYLGIIAGVLVIRRHAASGRLGHASVRLLLGSLVVATVADIATYWSYGTALNVLWSVGFGFELLALFGILVGTALLGTSGLRDGSSATGAILIGGAALAVPTTFVVKYVPHGPLLPIAIAIAVAALASPRVPHAARPASDPAT